MRKTKNGVEPPLSQRFRELLARMKNTGISASLARRSRMKALSAVCAIAQALLLLAALRPLAGPPPGWLLPLGRAQGLTAVSTATGLTAVLFLWLAERAPQAERNVNMSELYYWTCPCYLFNFAFFVISTCLTLYWGTPLEDNLFSWRLLFLFLCALLGILVMSAMCRCFIFSSAAYRGLLHAYLFSKTGSLSTPDEERSLALLTADLNVCFSLNDAKGVENIFQTLDTLAENIFPASERLPGLPLSYEPCRGAPPKEGRTPGQKNCALIHYYLKIWRILSRYVAPEYREELFRTVYARFRSGNAGTGSLVWACTLLQSSFPPPWPDIKAPPGVQLLNYLTTVNDFTHEYLYDSSTDSLLLQLCLFCRMYIQIQAAAVGERLGPEQRETLSALDHMITTCDSRFAKVSRERFGFLAKQALLIFMDCSAWTQKDFQYWDSSPRGVEMKMLIHGEWNRYHNFSWEYLSFQGGGGFPEDGFPDDLIYWEDPQDGFPGEFPDEFPEEFLYGLPPDDFPGGFASWDEPPEGPPPAPAGKEESLK